MSLLQTLPYKDYERALKFTKEQCEIIAKVADLRNISFLDAGKPGEMLMKQLDRQGYSANQYKQILNSAFITRKATFYKPQAKVAILIGNEQYIHLAKLATPATDCDHLGTKLKTLGFTVITLKNITSGVLKNVLVHLLEVVPNDSYCLVFYAGHGCEICNTKCLLSIDCPSENIQPQHFITENFLLNQVAKCKPDLCVLLMDMCRVNLDRNNNQNLFAQLLTTEDYSIHKNLLVGYSTLADHAAYEVVQIELSHSVDSKLTYELKTGDQVIHGASQYASALCDHIEDDCDVASLIDKVHGDVENSAKKQRPIKLQCGVAKRSLHDPATGDSNLLLKNLQKVVKQLNDNIIVL
ncbi:unnamed protein product [Plutella xylostella]|uniref:(diamondback moth) hypothetical protein n=1 Tax=Plutella xylostella TaxID=51655 RepID=A0A8S4F322_PLUXY|nr:unnamed protein product [Plutella xylostella]